MLLAYTCALSATTKKWPGENLSEFTEFLINKALREREEEGRHRSLRALNYMIGELGERLSNPVYGYMRSSDMTPSERGGVVPDDDQQFEEEMWKLRRTDLWRTDPFRFKAFKVAVKKLLDALEEPPGEMRSPGPPERERGRFRFAPTEELNERVWKALSSPEEWGTYNFEMLWLQSERSAPASDFEKQVLQRFPSLLNKVLREFYTLPRARADLEVKSKTKPEGKGND
jgi:hypothetical protein